MEGRKLVISTASQKGGVGKGTVSHMVSQGLAGFADAGILVAHAYTDSGEGRKGTFARKYPTYDCRTDDDLVGVIEGFAEFEVPDDHIAFQIFDGAGNKPHIDDLLSNTFDTSMHLILVPFGTSEEDSDLAKLYLDRYPNAIAVPSRWTSSWIGKKTLEAEIFEGRLADYKERIATENLGDGKFEPFVIEESIEFRNLTAEADCISPKMRTRCHKFARDVILPYFNITRFDLTEMHSAVKKWRRRQDQ